MKYIVTEVFYGSQGGIVFNPECQVEVFDHYVGALRFLVKERKLAQKLGYKVGTEWNEYPSKYGREWFVNMFERQDDYYYKYTVARINENGFH